MLMNSNSGGGNLQITSSSKILSCRVIELYIQRCPQSIKEFLYALFRYQNREGQLYTQRMQVLSCGECLNRKRYGDKFRVLS